MTIDLAAAAAVRDARITVAALHAELVSAGLVAWRSEEHTSELQSRP